MEEERELEKEKGELKRRWKGVAKERKVVSEAQKSRKSKKKRTRRGRGRHWMIIEQRRGKEDREC